MVQKRRARLSNECVTFVCHYAEATIKVTGGKAKYVAAQQALVWKVKRFQGLNELTLSAEVELVSTLTDRKPWRGPVHPLTQSLTQSLSHSLTPQVEP